MTLITSPIVDRVLANATALHIEFGPGLFESVYENCLAQRLAEEGLPLRRQEPVSLRYGNLVLPCAFRADLIVGDEVLVEIKAVERILPVHHSQVLTYLKCTRLRKGLLLNFNAPRLFVKSFVIG